MRKILVTGGAGFVGSSLCKKLLDRGDLVIALDNFHNYYSPEQKRKNISSFLDNKNFHLIEGDFRSKELLEDLFIKHKPDTIAHLGAMANVRYSVDHPGLFVDVNVLGTNNLLELSVKYLVENFVFASTSSIYGQRTDVPFFENDISDHPLAPYPASKKSGELFGYAYHNMHQLNFTALRFFNVYGPRGRPDMMPFIVAKSLYEGREITLFDEGKLERDWTYIDDVVNGVILALDKQLGYEIINIGRGEPSSMQKFMEIMQEHTDIQAKIINTEAPLSEPKITYADIRKAKNLLGYNPQTSLKEGLGNFLEWYKDSYL